MARKSTDTKTGWYPQAMPIGIPESNYFAGNDGPLAAVIHIVEGSYASCVSEFKAATQKSSHFLIAKDGRVAQFVSIYDTAYANGLTWSPGSKCWIDPEGNHLVPPHTPPWSLLHAPRNPNFYTISIEREGHYTDVSTAAMITATVALLAWLSTQFTALRPYKPLVNLIGHRHIGPIHRANCPGPNVDFAALAASANTLIPPTPTIPDPLKAELLPGPNGTHYACSIEVAGFYLAGGSVGAYGYPLSSELRATGLDGRVCSYMPCERVCIKNVKPDGVHLGLLKEAMKLRWI